MNMNSMKKVLSAMSTVYAISGAAAVAMEKRDEVKRTIARGYKQVDLGAIAYSGLKFGEFAMIPNGDDGDLEIAIKPFKNDVKIESSIEYLPVRYSIDNMVSDMDIGFYMVTNVTDGTIRKGFFDGDKLHIIGCAKNIKCHESIMIGYDKVKEMAKSADARVSAFAETMDRRVTNLERTMAAKAKADNKASDKSKKEEKSLRIDHIDPESK